MICIPKDIADVEEAARLIDEAMLEQKPIELTAETVTLISRLRLIAKRMEGQ